MIAVDTNVLVRLLVEDDAAQAAKSRALFDKLAEAGETAWVSDTVLVELLWTLARVYARPRDELARAVRALLVHASVTLESPAAVNDALTHFNQGVDFADCLLAVKAQRAGCHELATFDKGMKRLPQVRLL